MEHYRQTGDLEVLGKLFSGHTPMVFGVCLKYFKNREDARDGVMQIFEKLVKTLRAHQVETFQSWLYITTRNHCLMQLRERKTRLHQGISLQVVENELLLHLEEEPELEQNLGKLERCIEELAADQKTCIQLFFLQDKCYKDITGLTGYDLNSVKSYIQNGKRNLKNCMERGG